MTGFWLAAGVAVCVAALLMLVPVWRRADGSASASREALNVAVRKDQIADLEADVAVGTLSEEQLDIGRTEIEQGLIEDVAVADDTVARSGGAWVLYVTSVAVPALAIALYFQIGTPIALGPMPEPRQAVEESAHEITPDQLAGMVQSLADRLERNPDDPEGWMMLGRSYAVLGEHRRAADAYGRAYEMIGDHPDVLTNWADALAMANNQTFTPQAIRLIERALEAGPTHQKTLWLAGTVAYEAEDYARAEMLWTRLSDLLEPGSDMAMTIANNLAEVRGLMGGEAPTRVARTPRASAPATGSADAVGSHRVSGSVTLDPALADKVDPNAVLFVFARATSGPRMPLAIYRGQVSELPYTFSLDDTMAMMPAMSLARFPEVMVGARISRSGNAMPQPGDLSGMIGPVTVGSADLAIVIDTEVR